MNLKRLLRQRVAALTGSEAASLKSAVELGPSCFIHLDTCSDLQSAQSWTVQIPAYVVGAAESKSRAAGRVGRAASQSNLSLSRRRAAEQVLVLLVVNCLASSLASQQLSCTAQQIQ